MKGGKGKAAPMSRSAGGDFFMKIAEEAMTSARLLLSSTKSAPWLLKSTAVQRCPKWYLICTADLPLRRHSA